MSSNRPTQPPRPPEEKQSPVGILRRATQYDTVSREPTVYHPEPREGRAPAMTPVAPLDSAPPPAPLAEPGAMRDPMSPPVHTPAPGQTGYSSWGGTPLPAAQGQPHQSGLGGARSGAYGAGPATPHPSQMGRTGPPPLRSLQPSGSVPVAPTMQTQSGLRSAGSQSGPPVAPPPLRSLQGTGSLGVAPTMASAPQMDLSSTGLGSHDPHTTGTVRHRLPTGGHLAVDPSTVSQPRVRLPSGSSSIASDPTIASQPRVDMPVRQSIASDPTIASQPRVDMPARQSLASDPTIASQPRVDMPVRQAIASDPTIASQPRVPMPVRSAIASEPTIAAPLPIGSATGSGLGAPPTAVSNRPPTVAPAAPQASPPAAIAPVPPPTSDGFGIPGYRIRRLLGRGGMGEVYLAERMSDVGVAVPCVVKTIISGASNDPMMRQLFIDEVRLVAGLRHPNLVAVMDVGQAHDRLYQAIEWVEGMDLEGLADRAARSGEGVPLKHLLYVFRESLQGLHYVHSATGPDGRPLGIVHRDISPGNILISRQGAVKIADFGVALMTAGKEGGTQDIAGKPHYFAPEIWRGSPASVQTDVFAMGVTLYEMLCLRPLFKREGSLRDIGMEIIRFDPRQLLEQDLTIPEGVETLLLRSLAPKPTDRYASALEFLEDVNDYAYEYGIRLLDAHFSRYIERLMGGGPEQNDARKPLFRGNPE